ncbi:hypothetical protein KBY93_14325 [Synechococcus sp. J7-Johnson]|nr:hypothetical protein [Synechococcus sp. J7-Johnson]
MSLQQDQRYRLKAIESLAKEVYGGLSLCCREPIAMVTEVAKLFPDQPIAIVDPSYYIAAECLDDLDMITNAMKPLDSVLLPVRIRKGLASSPRLDQLYYNSNKRYLRINPFVVLNDFVTDRYLMIFTSGALQARMHSQFDIASELCSNYGTLRWIVTCYLLKGRMRLSSQQVVYCDHSLSKSCHLYSYHQMRLEVVQQISRLTKNRLYRAFAELLVNALNHFLAISDTIQNEHVPDTYLRRDLYKAISKSLPAVFPAFESYGQSSFNTFIHRSNWSHFFEQADLPVGSQSYTAKYVSASYPFYRQRGLLTSVPQCVSNSERPSISQAFLWCPLNRLLKELPEDDEGIVLLSDTLDADPTIHALIMPHEVKTGVKYRLACLAKADTLQEITLRLPARFFGEEIRVNINLANSSFNVVSGKPERVTIYAQPGGLVKCELVAIALKPGKSNVSVRLCKGSTSYYIGDGNGRVYVGKVELSSLSEPSDVRPRAKPGLMCHNLLLCNEDIFIPCYLLETADKGKESQDIKLITNVNADASYEFSFIVSCDVTASIDVDLLGSIFGDDGIKARFNLFDHSSCVLSGSPHQLKCIHLGDQRFQCSITAQSLHKGSQALFITFLERVKVDINSRGIETTIALHDLQFRVSQFLDANALSGPSISVIAVTYGMHNYIPEWLANYSLQSIHLSIGSELLIADPELNLPLQLYLEFFARVSGCNLHILSLLNDPGLYECWNRLIRMSRSKYISNFNPDDRKLPNHLESLISIAEETGADVCSSACYVSRVQEPCDVSFLPADIMNLEEKWWSSTSAIPSSYPLSCAKLVKRLTSDSIRANNQIHSMPVWTRDLHNRYGFFDEKEYSTYADFALWIKALRHGALAIFYPKALYMFSVIETSHNRVNKDQRILDLLLARCEE